ncbi:MAG: hypothetical protein R3C26_12395 [Calditrichia bacterium]
MTSQAFGINVAKVREIIRVRKLHRNCLSRHVGYHQFARPTPVLDLAQWLFNYEQPLERKS